jgi:thiol-disulfide isomerase/thioredoxin
MALLAGTVVAVTVLAACGPPAAGAGPGAVAISGSTGTSAQASGLAFHATTLSGSSFEASSLRGRPVALWFWAPWCTICRAEAPTVAKIAAAFNGRVTVVGVAGQGTVDQMRKFVAQTSTGGILQLADVRGSIWRQYQVVSQPSFVFVRANGQSDLFVGSLDEGTLTALMTATARGAAATADAARHTSGSLACNSDGSSLADAGTSATTGSLACDSTGPHATPPTAGSSLSATP